MSLSGHTSEVRPDRTFTMTGILPSQYLVSAMVAPASQANVAEMFAWSVQSATVAGKDVLDVPLDLKPNDALGELVITLTDRQQEVTGVLEDVTGRPASECTIVLFAADRRYWFPNSRRIVTARPATDGRFEISGGSVSLFGAGATGLPPGDYFLAAVSDLGDGDRRAVRNRPRAR